MYHLSGRGAQLTAIPIDSPDNPPNDLPTPPPPPACSMHIRSFSDSCYKDANTATLTPAYCKSPRCREKTDHHPQANGSANGTSPYRNGCVSNRENLLAKTDNAMSSLLVKLDQVAAVCHAAQAHGGGRLMCEEKFQVRALFLYVIHSSSIFIWSK